MVTRLSNVVEPAAWTAYEQEYSTEKNIFVRSGVIAPLSPEVQAQINSGGSVIDMPSWDDLARGFPAIRSDDPAVDIALDNITTKKMQAVKHYWAKAWGDMSLASEVATGDSKAVVKRYLDLMAEWWVGADQRALIASLTGVFADNAANDGNDMQVSLYSDVAAPTAANKISYSAVNRAVHTMGDALGQLTTIVMPSKVHQDAIDNDDIEFIRDSEGKLVLTSYMGLSVVVDDNLPSTQGTNSPSYDVYLLGAGCVEGGMAALPAEEAFEPNREPLKGNGGGQNQIITRKTRLLHPKGFSFNAAGIANKSPTEAELRTAGNWDRKFQRKNVRMARLVVN